MPGSVYDLRITLRHAKPAIWRRVTVPPTITLRQLHEIVQIAMGWTNSHLHQFVLRDKSLKPSRDEFRRVAQADSFDDVFINRMRGERVFVPHTTPFGDDTEMEGEDEDVVTLAEVCPKVKSKLIYEYDFGDGWEHTIEMRKIDKPETGLKYPLCLSGKHACPPEDCGGVRGYEQLLAVLADPNHEEHDDMSEWIGDEFDPEVFDVDEVNEMLAQWRDDQDGPELCS